MSKLVPKVNNTLVVKKNTKRKSIYRKFVKQRAVQAMVIPGIIWMAIFCYLPIYGLIIAFKNYSVIDGFVNSPWVGFGNFKEFLHSDNIYILFRNTLGISVLNLVIGFPVPIIFALLLNELRVIKFKKVVQTVSYLPYFISWIIAGGLFLKWVSVEGFINEILLKMGVLKIPIDFMSDNRFVWAILIITNIWKSFGWSSIIFLAAISTVDQEMYEAATVDGAGRFRKIWNITLPAIKGTVVIMFILTLSNILSSNFDQLIIMRNMTIRDWTDVIDTYTYDIGITAARYSYASAVGLFKSAIAIVILTLSNFAAKKLTDSALF